MLPATAITWALTQEARSLLARLDRVRPFALQHTVVPAAALSTRAQAAVERHVITARGDLRGAILRYLSWLQRAEARVTPAAVSHRRLVGLRLRFNAVLAQLDIFSEAMSQRSERENGVWLAGLDAVSEDALSLPGYLDAPPVVCYLARGPGAAIRRARTRLPGGGANPVAIIRVPRERMIGSGIASSLIHEVGHQASALLDLVASYREALRAVPRGVDAHATAWSLWERWISEVVADLWAIARVGVTSTMGLMSVVSLPRSFVFRTNFDDPHPMPWMRVKLSAAIGRALHPDPQWERLAALWESFYPREGVDAETRTLIDALEETTPRFVALLLQRRHRALRWRTLPEALGTRHRSPANLEALHRDWELRPARMRTAPPSLVFAVVGQARCSGRISPEEEGRVLADMLQHWALERVLRATEQCAGLKDNPRDLGGSLLTAAGAAFGM